MKKKRMRRRVVLDAGDDESLLHMWHMANNTVVLDIIREAWLLYADDPTPEALDRVLYLLDWDAYVRDPEYVSPPTIGQRPMLKSVLDGIVV